MSVNGITESISNNYTNYTPSAKAADSAVAATKKVAEDTGVVYEPSASATSNAGKTYTQNTELVTDAALRNTANFCQLPHAHIPNH